MSALVLTNIQITLLLYFDIHCFLCHKDHRRWTMSSLRNVELFQQGFARVNARHTFGNAINKEFAEVRGNPGQAQEHPNIGHVPEDQKLWQVQEDWIPGNVQFDQNARQIQEDQYLEQFRKIKTLDKFRKIRTSTSSHDNLSTDTNIFG